MAEEKDNLQEKELSQRFKKLSKKNNKEKQLLWLREDKDKCGHKLHKERHNCQQIKEEQMTYLAEYNIFKFNSKSANKWKQWMANWDVKKFKCNVNYNNYSQNDIILPNYFINLPTK